MKNGVLLLDKPTGISSARALYPVKRRFPRRKIGHTGTLDPFASGLLVVLVGYATRLSRFFLSMDKRYTATVVFGMETDTLDPEGEIVARAPVPTPDRVAAVIPRFRGKIEQVPPRYSALKTGGTRAYRAARAGEEFSLPSRQVHIYDIAITAEAAGSDETSAVPKQPTNPDRYTLDVHCGSGTYIRSLARDIGRVAGSVASLDTLRRTRVGSFSVDDAVPADRLDDESILPPGTFLSLTEAVREIPEIAIVAVADSDVPVLRNGGTPGTDVEKRADRVVAEGGPPYLLCVDGADAPVALFDRSGGSLTYAAVFPADEGVG
ncbi:MAG: tRNA pseudouridine(55) synthase TruB [Alkalispirochaeta sp.]